MSLSPWLRFFCFESVVREFTEAGARMWGSHLLVRTCVSTLEHQPCHLPEGSWGTSVSIHTFKSRASFSLTGSECVCSMEGRMSCSVCFQNKTQGRLGAAFPEVTSAIPACVSLAVGLGGHLITVNSSQGKALARKGRGGKGELPSWNLCAHPSF